MASMKHQVYIFPRVGSVKEIFDCFEKEYPSVFSICGKFIKTENNSIRIPEKQEDFFRFNSDVLKYDVFEVFFSDDLGTKGYSFSSYTLGKTELVQGLLSKDIGTLSFLISMGLEEYLCEILL